jgi:uncharacterized protein YhbP (UPF0306 family)
MQALDPPIVEFIYDHHVLTLATCADNVPYCASLFYVFMKEENRFVITSEKKTRHISEIMNNHKVAGNIALETETVGLIRGLQFQGKMTKPEGALKQKATFAYLKRFPYAILKGATIWTIELSYAKFTDNRLGFGKKLYWEK